MKLVPLLILMTAIGLVVGVVFSSWVSLLILAPGSVVAGYVAGRSNRQRELR